VVVLLTAGSFTPVKAATLTVNTGADDNIVNGNCTLREAIRASVQHAHVDGCPAGTSNDLIVFGVTSVNVNSTLPLITTGNTVTILGSSQKVALHINVQSGSVFSVGLGSTLNIQNINFQGGNAGTCIDSAGNLTLIGDSVAACPYVVMSIGGQVKVQSSTVSMIDTHNSNFPFTAIDSVLSGGVPFTLYLGSAGGTITHSTFSIGQVNISTLGPLNISRTTFNHAGNIAAISASGTTVTLANSIITGTTQGARPRKWRAVYGR
jgi:CSLREA domain-containing protein